MDIRTAQAELAAAPTNSHRLEHLLTAALQHNAPLYAIALLSIACTLRTIQSTIEAIEDRPANR